MPLPWRSRRTCLSRVEACSWTRHAGIKTCSIPVDRSLTRTACVMHSSNSGSKTGRLCLVVSMHDHQGPRRSRRQRHRFQELSGSSAQPKKHLRPGRPNSFVRSMTGFDSTPRARRITISAQLFAISVPTSRTSTSIESAEDLPRRMRLSAACHGQQTAYVRMCGRPVSRIANGDYVGRPEIRLVRVTRCCATGRPPMGCGELSRRATVPRGAEGPAHGPAHPVSGQRRLGLLQSRCRAARSPRTTATRSPLESSLRPPGAAPSR
jgi:hypothetical protein